MSSQRELEEEGKYRLAHLSCDTSIQGSTAHLERGGFLAKEKDINSQALFLFKKSVAEIVSMSFLGRERGGQSSVGKDTQHSQQRTMPHSHDLLITRDKEEAEKGRRLFTVVTIMVTTIRD